MPVSVSGLNSNIDTDSLIRKLVEVEKRPIVRLQEEKKDLEYQKEVWKDFNKELTQLDSVLKKLYGFNKVFDRKKVDGKNDEYFSALAQDNAKKGEHSIEILNIAKAHKIKSDEIQDKKNLPGAIFEISINNEKVKIEGFQNGGTLEDLNNVLNNEAGKLIQASIIKVDEDNIILSIESLITGEKNELRLSGDKKAEKLFQELGLYTTEQLNSVFYNFNDQKPEGLPFSSQGLSNSFCLSLEPNKKLNIDLPKPIKLQEATLSFYFRSLQKQETGMIDNLLKKNIGSVTIKDIIISGANFILNKLNKEIPVEKKEVSVKLNSDTTEEMMFPLTPNQNWTNITIPIKSLKSIKSLEFNNPTSYQFFIDQLNLNNKNEDKKVFKNIVQKPEEARLKVDGIEITRDKNTDLNDIIKGVTLNLEKETPKSIRIQIKEDKEAIEKEMDSFITKYNETISYIIEASKTSKTTKPGEKQKQERGALSNDMTLINLYSKMRSTVVNSYITSLGEKLAILAQIGISTGKWGSDWDNVHRGLLEKDTEKWNSAFSTFGEKVGDIFGYDSNKDKLIDTGVAYELSKMIKGFTQYKGIIDGKISMIDNQIQTKDKNIAKKEDDVSKYEETLKAKFGKMDRALQGLKGTSEALDSQINNLPSSDNSKQGEK